MPDDQMNKLSDELPTRFVYLLSDNCASDVCCIKNEAGTKSKLNRGQKHREAATETWMSIAELSITPC